MITNTLGILLILFAVNTSYSDSEQDSSSKCRNLSGVYRAPDKDDPRYNFVIKIDQNGCQGVQIEPGSGRGSATGWINGSFLFGSLHTRSFGSPPNHPHRNYKVIVETLATIEGDALKIVQTTHRSENGQPFFGTRKELLLRLNESDVLYRKLEETNTDGVKIVREQNLSRVVFEP